MFSSDIPIVYIVQCNQRVYGWSLWFLIMIICFHISFSCHMTCSWLLFLIGTLYSSCLKWPDWVNQNLTRIFIGWTSFKFLIFMLIGNSTCLLKLCSDWLELVSFVLIGWNCYIVVWLAGMFILCSEWLELLYGVLIGWNCYMVFWLAEIVILCEWLYNMFWCWSEIQNDCHGRTKLI